MQVLRRFGNGCPPIQGAPLLECQRLPLLNSIVVGLEVERNGKKAISYLALTSMYIFCSPAKIATFLISMRMNRNRPCSRS